MSKVVGLICVLALLMGYTGLPVAREMGDMALMRTLGVDSGTKDGVALTASTGERAKGLQREVTPPLILSAEHPSISGASLALQGLSDNFIFYGYVDQLLLGQDLAEEGISEVLDYFAHNVELGLGTEVWMIDGSAGDAIKSGEKIGVDDRLSTLHADSELGVAGNTRTTGEVLTDILEHGATYIPILKVGEGENTTLLEAGYGLFRKDKLVGTLTGDEARGLELIEGSPAVNITEMEVGDNTISLRMEKASTQLLPKFDGSDLVGLTIQCQLIAYLAEFQHTPNGEDFQYICQVVGAQEEKRMADALKQMQQWGVDGLGLGHAIGMRAPQHWKQLQKEWESIFPDLPIQVVVDVTIRRTE